MDFLPGTANIGRSSFRNRKSTFTNKSASSLDFSCQLRAHDRNLLSRLEILECECICLNLIFADDQNGLRSRSGRRLEGLFQTESLIAQLHHQIMPAQF